MQTATSQFLQPYLAGAMPWLYVQSYWWTIIGFTGNFIFGSRFLFQWLASEKKKEVVVPSYFWWLSFWGSAINLIYALHIDNAPIIFGVAALPFIYGRNLVLMKRSEARNEAKKATKREVITPVPQPVVQSYQTVQA